MLRFYLVFQPPIWILLLYRGPEHHDQNFCQLLQQLQLEDP
jgi:hypothetical protein